MIHLRCKVTKTVPYSKSIISEKQVLISQFRLYFFTTEGKAKAQTPHTGWCRNWGGGDSTNIYAKCLCSLCLPELMTVGLWGLVKSLDDPHCCCVCTPSDTNSGAWTVSKHLPRSLIFSGRSDWATFRHKCEQTAPVKACWACLLYPSALENIIKRHLYG